jgi:hypothetical protein
MTKPFSAGLSAMILICLCTPAAWAQKASLPFIEDDYAQALAQGRQRNLPLFVEVWAPW